MADRGGTVNRSDMSTKRQAAWWGIVCTALAALGIGAGFIFQCPRPAIALGAFSFLNGAALGTALAFVTRTRRPIAIYAGLVLAVLTLFPLLISWPAAHAPIWLPPSAAEAADSYLEALRWSLFVLGIPYPFIRLGQHAPDPVREEPDLETQDHLD